LTLNATAPTVIRSMTVFVGLDDLPVGPSAAIDLVIVESPYRALIAPLMAYVDAKEKQDPRRPVTIVLAEFVPRHFWEYALHNQTALQLKLSLFFRPNTVVVDVPYHLSRNVAPTEDLVEEVV
jgi:hypothetical protein